MRLGALERDRYVLLEVVALHCVREDAWTIARVWFSVLAARSRSVKRTHILAVRRVAALRPRLAQSPGRILADDPVRPIHTGTHLGRPLCFFESLMEALRSPIRAMRIRALRDQPGEPLGA